MYKKVKVIFLTNPNDRDDFSDTYSVEYENCSIDIKGGHFIIQVHKTVKDNKVIDGYIFNLNEIKSYKATY